MGAIKSSLELIDKVTAPLDAINSRLGISIERFDKAGSSADKMGDEAGAAADRARVKLGRFSTTLDTIPGGLNRVNAAMRSVTSRSNSMFKAMLGVAAIQKILGVVTSQIGNAFDRMDTLNNYPKVMGNLGIRSADAERSIDEMSERLKGLPTTLQDAASSVQRFTSANGNVQASTEMFLALNNAILAGGADMNTQRSALEQLSQSYAKGKPDMMEWRTAMTAMPAQLKQVAQAMGYASADELGESLRKGEISMNEFMATMVKMNHESVAGFKTLEEQARNATGGFATSIANMKSAVTRGLTGMVDNVNDALSRSGLPTLQEIITNIGSTIEKVLKAIGTVFGKIIAWIAENKEEILGWIKIIASVAIAWGIVSTAVSALIGIITTITTLISTFGSVFGIVFGAGAIAAVVGLSGAISGLVDWFTETNEKTGDIGKTMEIVFARIGVIIAKVKKIFMTAFDYIKIGWNTMCLGFEVAFKGVAAVILSIWDTITSGVEKAVKGIFEIIAALVENIPGMEDIGAGDMYRAMGNNIDFATNSADSLWKEIEDSTAATDKENQALWDEINGGLDNEVTKAEANAKALEDRYTRNLGNNRGGTDSGKNKNGKTALDAVVANTGTTAKNVKAIAKQMTVNGEMLKYIRDFSYQKAVNRYTSSTIKVDMTNNNNMASGADVDGIMRKLKKTLEKEMAATAEGVHA